MRIRRILVFIFKKIKKLLRKVCNFIRKKAIIFFTKNENNLIIMPPLLKNFKIFFEI